MDRAEFREGTATPRVWSVGGPPVARAHGHSLRDAEVVLAEGTGGQPPGKRLKDEELPPEGLWVRRYLSVTARILGLEEQWRWEASVVDPRWVLADMETKELAAAMRENAITILPDEAKALVTRLETLVAGSPAPEELARARDEVQRMEMNTFYRYRGPEGGEARVQQLREDVMWRIVRERLASGKHKRVALVFGAWHAYNLEPKLVSELGFRLEGTSWHDCQIFERSAMPVEGKR